jgi:hypothetical protein
MACGPHFPNWLLDGSDSQVLSAPVMSFAAEIRKLDPCPAPYPADPSDPGKYAADTLAAELSDLREALKRSGLSAEAMERILMEHQDARERLLDYVQRRQGWLSQFAWNPNNTVPPPSMPSIPIAEGLPVEFVEYFQGALAWHSGDTNGARKIWAALLSRPEEQRWFKSTWAAYMLGRSWEEVHAGKAARYYQRTRHYVDQGLPDSASLAAASIGREARALYLAGDCAAAIRGYLMQAATGDRSALVSLRWAAKRALHEERRSLPALARDPVSRRVITAYIVSQYRPTRVHLDGPLREGAIQWLGKTKYFRAAAPTWHRYSREANLWLRALEKAKVTQAEEAASFALAAYQAGEFDAATRWLERASPSTLALWLRAKLLLRDGRIDPAAECLAAVVRGFRDSEQPVMVVPASEHLVFVDTNQAFMPILQREASDEALGELGALRLVQGEYTLALDALLRAGFWMDAAYVAERVLTIEQLQMYVATNWPVATEESEPARQIRYLLARRLARLEQWAEARPFYPESMRPSLDVLAQALRLGRDEQQPATVRAEALWTAAQLLRKEGMELIGTEGEPDWAIHGGNFEIGVTATDRASSSALRPTTEELDRAKTPTVSPDQRFHYRHRAADLAWEAASLMPDQDEETALVLYAAGCWLKARHPKEADRFYKALVNRCGNTPLGHAADQKRWFPREGDW